METVRILDQMEAVKHCYMQCCCAYKAELLLKLIESAGAVTLGSTVQISHWLSYSGGGQANRLKLEGTAGQKTESKCCTQSAACLRCCTRLPICSGLSLLCTVCWFIPDMLFGCYPPQQAAPSVGQSSGLSMTHLITCMSQITGYRPTIDVCSYSNSVKKAKYHNTS